MPSPATRQPAEVAPGVVRLGTRFVNWYLLADADGVTAVDTGVPGYAPQLAAGLARLGRQPGDIRPVRLTHGDADHTGVADTTPLRDGETLDADVLLAGHGDPWTGGVGAAVEQARRRGIR